MCVCVCSVTQLCPTLATPWTRALQAPLSMGVSRQECWSGWPCPSPGGLPDPGIKLASLTSPALTGGFFTTSATWEAPVANKHMISGEVYGLPWGLTR